VGVVVLGKVGGECLMIMRMMRRITRLLGCVQMGGELPEPILGRTGEIKRARFDEITGLKLNWELGVRPDAAEIVRKRAGREVKILNLSVVV